jgi:hypothetical protein
MAQKVGNPTGSACVGGHRVTELESHNYYQPRGYAQTHFTF